MNDGNLTPEIVNKMVADWSACNCGAAATAWMKYTGDTRDVAQPRIGEWCLWSIVTRHGREYYAGSLAGDGKIRMDFGIIFPITDETYFARVGKIID